jgi:hypothetical protein
LADWSWVSRCWFWARCWRIAPSPNPAPKEIILGSRVLDKDTVEPGGKELP